MVTKFFVPRLIRFMVFPKNLYDTLVCHQSLKTLNVILKNLEFFCYVNIMLLPNIHNMDINMTITITIIKVNKYIKNILENIRVNLIQYCRLEFVLCWLSSNYVERSQSLSQYLSVFQWWYQINMLITWLTWASMSIYLIKRWWLSNEEFLRLS